MTESTAKRTAMTTRPQQSRQPFSLLLNLFSDEVMDEIFSEERTIQGWLDAEVALAHAQATVGVLTPEDAAAIAGAARLETIDPALLWRESRIVGYPILSLVRMIAAALPEGPNGRVHYGATTQDIMDTGLALQLRAALDRLETLLGALGDAVACLIEAHRHTVLAARTHAQQAVPTTVGVKLSVLLTELVRQRDRIAGVRPRVGVVSLFGAGGTAAALGESAIAIRIAMADRLDLTAPDVPWHVARDSIAEFGLVCSSIAATCARFAREVIDLSRTEIGEMREHFEHHRGASSTMPQKANPIGSEAIVGMSTTAGALASALFRAMEAGHERAAGEWQIEWQVLPQLATLAAGCLHVAADVAAGLQVFPDVMERNLRLDGGLVMAEAYMMRLAPLMGREKAHDLVYDASAEARERGEHLDMVLRRYLSRDVLDAVASDFPLAPKGYVGQPNQVCDSALALWSKRPTRKEYV